MNLVAKEKAAAEKNARYQAKMKARAEQEAQNAVMDLPKLRVKYVSC